MALPETESRAHTEGGPWVAAARAPSILVSGTVCGRGASLGRRQVAKAQRF